jgi:hypothetical protein
MDGVTFGLKPRNEAIGKLVQACADGKLPFSGPDSLCAKISAMGYKTTSLYEMVRAASSADANHMRGRSEKGPCR